MKSISQVLLTLIITLPFGIWGVLSLLFGSWSTWLCMFLLIIYGIAFVCVFILIPLKWVIPIQAVLFMIPLISFLMMKPSHNRVWQNDVALMPFAEIEGDRITINNIRNFEYTSEMTYQQRYESRIYDLQSLRSIDVIFSDWGLEHVMHTMISFGFANDDYICLSIETRKEEGETYSALKGFFRQYELIYVLADERDVVRLRTNFRKGEDVYLYRLRVASSENLRLTFLNFINRVNELHESPRWYNALYENCMTSAFRIARKYAVEGKGNWHWSTILNGHSARHAYDNGLLDTTLSFQELQEKSHVNIRARTGGDAADFSFQIRKDLPGMDYIPPH